MSQRSRLRRRPAALAPVTTPTGPMYQARLGGALGCHFCEAFRKLATIDTYRDIPRALKVMEEGKCFPTVSGRPLGARARRGRVRAVLDGAGVGRAARAVVPDRRHGGRGQQRAYGNWALGLAMIDPLLTMADLAERLRLPSPDGPAHSRKDSRPCPDHTRPDAIVHPERPVRHRGSPAMPLHLRLRGAVWHARGSVRVGRATIPVPEFSTGARRRADAETIAADEEARLRADHLEGDQGRAKRLTLADCFKSYLTRPGGVPRYDQDRIADFNAHIGGRLLAKAKPAWHEWLRTRGAAMAPATAARWRAILQAAIGAGCLVHDLPVPRLPTVRVRETEGQRLSDDGRARPPARGLWADCQAGGHRPLLRRPAHPGGPTVGLAARFDEPAHDPCSRRPFQERQGPRRPHARPHPRRAVDRLGGARQSGQRPGVPLSSRCAVRRHPRARGKPVGQEPRDGVPAGRDHRISGARLATSLGELDGHARNRPDDIDEARGLGHPEDGAAICRSKRGTYGGRHQAPGIGLASTFAYAACSEQAEGVRSAQTNRS